MTTYQKIKDALLTNVTSSPERIKIFFKTAPGSYAEHDQFIGVTVPVLRKIAKVFSDINLEVLEELLHSRINEERLLALLILTERYKRGDTILQEQLYQFYLKHLAHVNNWNLVDASAHLIIGAYLWDKDRSLLAELARSDNLWQRRIAIVSTWYFIRNNDLRSTFQIAELLRADKHDLIHKATGWMLREAGKRNTEPLIEWLQQYAKVMPRTMLRYAIERLDAEQKASIMTTQA